jgi:hypothetical protein
MLRLVTDDEIVDEIFAEDDVLSHASLLLLTAATAPAPADITPLSLAVRPQPIELGHVTYDWTLQRSRGATLKLADGTATCDTGPLSTHVSGQSDSTHDCRFD